MDRTSKEYQEMRDKALLQLRSGKSLFGSNVSIRRITSCINILVILPLFQK